MDYRYLYPIFGEDDIDEAISYLGEQIIDDNSIKLLKETSYGIEQVSLSEIPDDSIKKIVNNIIINAYGQNCVLMANYFKTEEIFTDKLESNLLRYLDYCGFNASITSIQVGAIASKILMHKALTETNYTPISRWNPSEKWISMEYGKHADINLMNPINSCKHCILTIRGSINTSFIKEIRQYNFKFNYKSNGDEVTEVSIFVLPARNHFSTVSLIKLIHKYF